MGDETLYYVCCECGRVFPKYKDEEPNMCDYGFSPCISESFRLANRFDFMGVHELAEKLQEMEDRLVAVEQLLGKT